MNKAKYVQNSEMTNKEELLRAKSNILNLIKQKKIKFRPKWYYISSEIFFWIVCALLVITASFALGIFIDTIFDSDEGLLFGDNLSDNGILYIFRSFFWFCIFFFIAILAYLDFIRLRRGYKIFTRATQIILTIYILLSVTLYITGTFECMEQFFIKNIPYYSAYLSMNIS